MLSVQKSKSASTFVDPISSKSHAKTNDELLTEILNPQRDGIRFSSDGDDQIRHRTKPWIRHGQAKSARVGTRVPLDKISNHEAIYHYTPNVAGHILVRLERLMGTSKVSFLDSKYLERLLVGIRLNDQKDWEVRRDQRIKSEIDRQRQLVIDGKLEPAKGDTDVLKHPIFRVNRIMKRLSVNDSGYSDGPIEILPRIRQVEPFHSTEQNKLLFPEHKNHYKRASGLQQGRRPSTAPLSSSRLSGSLVDNESIILPDFKKINKAKPSPSVPLSETNFSTASSRKIISNESNEQSIKSHTGIKNESAQKIPEKASAQHFTDTPSSGISSLSFRESLKLDLKELLQTQSVTQLTKLLKLDVNDLEKTWKLGASKYIDELLEENKEDVNEMFNYANGVSSAYQREQSKVDDFVLKFSRTLT